MKTLSFKGKKRLERGSDMICSLESRIKTVEMASAYITTREILQRAKNLNSVVQ